MRVSTDRQHRGTTAPCTSQTQATTNLFAAQEGNIASQRGARGAGQATAKERAGHDGVVLVEWLCEAFDLLGDS
ncbi:MAG: hypothetical protein DME61_00670 [Verrucomicrobia bacterium]|nr:MAG: hypothetical protein DME61_00670 [Verrucomicrobiota bacterium]